MGRLKSCDFAMNWTCRLVNIPTKKWSMNEKWFGARIRGPVRGIRSAPMPRERNATMPYSVVRKRTAP
jgi:hypothetical protein